MQSTVPPPVKTTAATSDSASRREEDAIELEIQRKLMSSSTGGMCIGSTTGEILGLTESLHAVRKEAGVEASPVMMCFWGAFVK